MHKVFVNPTKIQYVITYRYTHMMKTTFIIHKFLKLASGTQTEWILKRDKKHNEIYQKITKKLLQKQKNKQTKLIHTSCQPQT